MRYQDFIWQRDGLRGGRPCIRGTGVSVERIITWTKLGYSPEQIADQIGHINVEQVEAALAYYRDHQDEVETSLAREDQEALQLEMNATRSRVS